MAKRVTEVIPRRDKISPKSTVHRGRRKVIVTIVESTGERHWPMEFEIDGFQLTEENGRKKAEQGYESNGQHRVCLKFWRGCNTYEDFVPEE